MNRRKQFMTLALIIFSAMVASFYCATFADFTTSVKIGFGLMTLLLYVMLLTMPHYLDKRRNPQLKQSEYLKGLIKVTIAAD